MPKANALGTVAPGGNALGIEAIPFWMDNVLQTGLQKDTRPQRESVRQFQRLLIRRDRQRDSLSQLSADEARSLDRIWAFLIQLSAIGSKYLRGMEPVSEIRLIYVYDPRSFS